MIDCTETHSSVAREPGYEEDSKKHKSNKINKEWDVNNLVLLKEQHWNPQKKHSTVLLRKSLEWDTLKETMHTPARFPMHANHTRRVTATQREVNIADQIFPKK